MSGHHALVAALTIATSLFSLAAPARAQEAAQRLPTKIAGVTVYEDRALVTRTATIQLGQGSRRVAFEHLPAAIDVGSLRARATGARVMGLDVETVHLAEARREDVQLAQLAVRSRRRNVEAATLVHRDASAAWETLNSLRATTMEGVAHSLGEGLAPDAVAIGRVLDFVTERSAGARKAIVSATGALESATAELEAAERRLQELAGLADKRERRVVVTLTATAPTSASVTLSYLVRGATWRPVYDMRVAGDFSGMELALGAMVTQRTGEDWSGVDLELTTAQPAAGASPPAPSPWRISLPRPAAAGPSADAGPVARKMRRAAAPKEEAEDLEGGYADRLLEVRTRRSGLVVAFRAHRKETVRTDGRPTRVSLAEFALEPTVEWTAFPRATKKVYATAKAKNSTGAPLPAGEARVFLGPDFVGPMQLADWGMEKEIEIGLGVDRQVEVAREELVKERSTTGIFSKDTVHSRRYRITVTNHRATPIDVRILDQLPVSSDEELEVELTEESLARAKLPPEKAETHKAQGILEWRQSVAPGTNVQLYFAFEVRHPKGKPVYGLGE